MGQTSFYLVFDYESIQFEQGKKKTKCCKRFKKKGKRNCADCPKLS